MKKLVLLLSLILIQTAYAQEISIKDSISQKNILFAVIVLKDNNGFYSSADGKFNLNQIDEDHFSVYAMGYESKVVDKKTIGKTILLSPNYMELEEVLISSKPLKLSKFKRHRIKAKRHNNFMDAHRLLVGNELAVYIPNQLNPSKETVLNSIEIPIVTKTMEDGLVGTVQRLKKHPFSSLYKISFYTIKDGMPDKKLDYGDISIVLDEKSNLVKLDLSKYYINLPADGLFVGISNMGRTDEHGRLISEKSYEYKETDKGLVKIAAITKPYFPVIYTETKHLTFYRNSFNEQKGWKTFYKYYMVKENEYHNISFGFELKVFE